MVSWHDDLSVKIQIPNFSDFTALLRALLKKDMSWSWSEQHDLAFSHLKQLVVSAPVLRFFDPSKPVVIQTDSSSTGLGSCLLQDGLPIAYASTALADSETRYAQIEQELLAVVFATEKFFQYIYCKQPSRVIINYWKQYSANQSVVLLLDFRECCFGY